MIDKKIDDSGREDTFNSIITHLKRKNEHTSPINRASTSRRRERAI